MAQESIYVAGETYTSARATPELVGRGDELSQIEQAIRDTSQSYLIYITGEGGIGKTRLVQHILEQPPNGLSLTAASELIDLYHTRVHSLAGLIGAILDVVKPLGEYFRDELKQVGADKLEEVARAEHEGFTLAEIISRREELTKLFITTFNRYSDQQRVILALDTTERLQAADPTQEMLGLTAERPAILNWLLNDFLPNVRNAVVLLAGRPGPDDLTQALEHISNQQFLSITLKGLAEREALDYFEAVVKSARASGNPGDAQAAETIRRWSREDRKAIFHCLRDEGDPPAIRPILLALAIDHLVVAGYPLPALTRSPAEAQALTSHQRRETQAELGSALVQTLRDHRRPADEVILALGWLRKGADATLLARITGLDQGEVEEAQEKIKDLSFVKIRPADNRLFLHDEMYDLLQRHGLDRVSDAQRERVFKTMQAYYDERIDRAHDRVAELYRPLTETALPEVDQVIAARARLQDALLEDLYYRLRWDAGQGFQTYFRYAEEAITASDESLDMQLRAELLGFLAERDPSGETEEIDGLRWADVVADASVRWIKRLIGRGEYQQARDVAQKVRENASELLTPGGDLPEAELDTWEGLALAYMGKLVEAEPLLDRAITRLLSVRKEVHSRRWSGISARAYNNLGYWARVQGQIIRAAAMYRQALPRWRRLGMETEQANTLTNLAFVLGLQGKFPEARQHGLKALTLRECLGPRGPVALTCNTLAEIYTRAGYYREAEPYAHRALSLSQSLEFQRGEGLALITGSILHRYMSEPPDVSAVKKMALLNEAVQECTAALNIFLRKVKEPEREIRAYTERGVTYRELSRMTGPGKEKEEYAIHAKKDLSRALSRAQKEELWLAHLDASLGLAWTHYYFDETEKLEHILKDLDQDIQEHFNDYRLTAGKLPEIGEDTSIHAFGQFARLHVLRGVRAMDMFERSDKQPPYPDLRKASREFTIALEYDRLIAEEHYLGTSRALNTIHSRLEKLSEDVLKVFYDSVAEVIQELERDKEKCRLWRALESAYGPYEILSQLATWRPALPGM